MQAKPSFLTLQDCVFSSQDQLLAVGLVSGGLRLYDCKQPQQPLKVAALKAHSGSCRAVCYDSSGLAVHTASANGSMLSVDVATKRRKVQQKAAHPVGVCRLCTAAPNMIASGKLLPLTIFVSAAFMQHTTKSSADRASICR